MTDPAVVVPARSAAEAIPGFVGMKPAQTGNRRTMAFDFTSLEGAKELYRMHMDATNEVFSRYRATVAQRAAEVGTTYELSWMLSKVLSMVLVCVFFMGSAISAADQRFIIPAAPAATYDLIGRLFAHHMGYVPQNQPGASGVSAANALYKSPNDGSVIGIVHIAAIQAQALDEPAVRFDATKFNWIGTPTREGGTIVVWHGSKVRTLADLSTTEITVGVSNIRQLAYVRLMNEKAGTKFKIIRGYPSGAEIALALQRGEVECSVVFPWSVWRANYPDLVSERKIIPIAQLSTPDPALSIPLLADQWPFLTPLAAIDGIGRPLALPPNASEAAVKSARQFFHSLMHSPVFIADAKKIGLEVDPVSGPDLDRLVKSVISMPDETKAILKGAID